MSTETLYQVVRIEGQYSTEYQKWCHFGGPVPGTVYRGLPLDRCVSLIKEIAANDKIPLEGSGAVMKGNRMSPNKMQEVRVFIQTYR
jgi:hypothetical protein